MSSIQYHEPLPTHLAEMQVEVEKYDEPGSIYIHVFDNDQIRVVVTNHPGYSRLHPIPAPVAPAGWKKN